MAERISTPSRTKEITNEQKNENLVEDNKGYYVSVFDKDNNVIVEETYTEEDNYDYQEVEKKLDVEKIIKCKNIIHISSF